MLTIIVWCLPADQSEETLRQLCTALVGIAVGTPGLEVGGEQDLVVLFPKDLMTYGLGEEIIIQVTEAPPDFECRRRLGTGLVYAVKMFFPNSRVECKVTPRSQNDVFVSSEG